MFEGIEIALAIELGCVLVLVLGATLVVFIEKYVRDPRKNGLELLAELCAKMISPR